MVILRSLYLLWLVPASWLSAFLVRRKPFEERYRCMRKWAKKLLRKFKVTCEVTQKAPLPSEGPILFVCNHQSEFDMLLQMAVIDVPFTFVSKKENETMPYVGSWSKSLEVIFFDREDRGSAIHMLREGARRLKEGKHLLIFPEGTRSKGATMHPMQAGSIQPAFMAKATIVPIVLVNSYDYMQVMMHKQSFTMHILKPLPYEEYKAMKADGCIALLQERMQKVLDAETKKKAQKA